MTQTKKHIVEHCIFISIPSFVHVSRSCRIYLNMSNYSNISLNRFYRLLWSNFLGLLLNENMSRKPQIDLSSNRIAKCAGVLNKLKRFLPIHILRTLYFSMVQSRMMYVILAWGFDYYRIEKIQKRFVRIISSSKYNTRSEPLFKVLDILKIEHFLLRDITWRSIRLSAMSI